MRKYFFVLLVAMGALPSLFAAKAEAGLPVEYSLGAGYFHWIGVGVQAGADNLLAPGLGFRARTGLDGVELSGVLKLGLLYGVSGVLSLGAGYGFSVGKRAVLGSLGLEYRPEFLRSLGVFVEYASYWFLGSGSSHLAWSIGVDWHLAWAIFEA